MVEPVKARLAAARTVSVPSAAPVLGADLEGATPWLASAFVAGVPLAKAVAEHGPLPEPVLLSLAAGLAEALAAVHAAGGRRQRVRRQDFRVRSRSVGRGRRQRPQSVAEERCGLRHSGGAV